MKPLIPKNQAPGSFRRVASRMGKQLTPVYPSDALIFEKKNELIISISLLPLTIILRSTSKDSDHQFVVNVSQHNVVVKSQEESSVMNVFLYQKKWMRVSLGEEFQKIEIKRCENQNKINKNLLFSCFSEWKKGHVQEIKLLSQVFLKENIKKFRQKTKECSTKNDHLFGSKKSIAVHMRNKLSQRCSLVNKNKYIPFSDKQVSTQKQITDDKSVKFPVFQKNKYLSSIDNEKSQKPSNSSNRQSCTSTSIRRQMTSSKASSNLNRLRNLMIESKIGKSEKQTTVGGDLSHLNDQHHFHVIKKPKFYQNLNMSQEELQKKKRKFDSQFIPTQLSKEHISEQSDESPLKKNVEKRISKQSKQQNESSVMEQIQRIKTSNCFEEDSFERGIDKRVQQSSLCQSEQIGDSSGTLYESVYQ